jgi:hypothetical protein
VLFIFISSLLIACFMLPTLIQKAGGKNGKLSWDYGVIGYGPALNSKPADYNPAEPIGLQKHSLPLQV